METTKIYSPEEIKNLHPIFLQAEELWAMETKKWLLIHGEEWFPVRNIGIKVKIKYPRDRKTYNCTVVAPTGTPDSRALIATYKIALEFLLKNNIDCFFDKGR